MLIIQNPNFHAECFAFIQYPPHVFPPAITAEILMCTRFQTNRAYSRFINTMNFSDEDLNKIILVSDNAIEYFLENGIETAEELKQRILNLDKINSNVLISAILFNIITADEFLKMYSLGKIDIEEIKKIKNKLKDKKDFEKIVSSKKLIS